MASHMEAKSFERFLVHILTPVYRLVEDVTIHDFQMGKCFYPILFELPIVKSLNLVHRRTEDDGRRAPGLGADERSGLQNFHSFITKFGRVFLVFGGNAKLRLLY